MKNNNPNFDFSEKELQVSEILLDLPYLFTHSLSNIRFDNSWNTKRRRSVPNDSPLPVNAILPSPPCEAVSPNTPLSYCPSESEGKSKNQSTQPKTSVKRIREELLQLIDDKTQNCQILSLEISKVKLHLQKLDDENSQLRVKKQKFEEVRTKLEPCDGLYPQQHNYNSILSGPSTSTEHQYHLPLFLPLPTVQVEQEQGHRGPATSTEHQYHLPLFLPQPTVQVEQEQEQDHRGFDLNIPAEEEIERPVQLPLLDYHHTVMMSLMSNRRACIEQARAARRHRTELNKAKKLQRGR